MSEYVNDNSLPPGSARRKEIPLARGVLDYFPAALAAVAELSRAGNEKHNPGQELHHARGKSMDHADCILRHLVDRGRIDPEDNILHDVKVAWRALAMLQEALEERGAPLARGARLPEHEKRNPLRQQVDAEWVLTSERLKAETADLVQRAARKLEAEVAQQTLAARCDSPDCKECGGPA